MPVDPNYLIEQERQQSIHHLERLLAAYKAQEQQLTQARDIIRRLYGSFRWETNTETQEAACKDAENFLELPPDKRREWE